MPRKTSSPPARASRHPACFNEAAARCRGKLSPDRHDVLRTHASMRPRPDAAENDGRGANVAVGRDASMRPRPDAAENAGAQPEAGLSAVLQ